MILRVPKKNFKEKKPQGFTTEIENKSFHGFIVKVAGGYFAFQNRCCHLPVTLDLLDNDFLNEEGNAIQCHMHGAVYDMQTGECTAGPCIGSRLTPLKVKEEKESICIQL